MKLKPGSFMKLEGADGPPILFIFPPVTRHRRLLPDGTYQIWFTDPLCREGEVWYGDLSNYLAGRTIVDAPDGD